MSKKKTGTKSVRAYVKVRGKDEYVVNPRVARIKLEETNYTVKPVKVVLEETKYTVKPVKKPA